jgi:Domain of unknown function (DUF4384)
MFQLPNGLIGGYLSKADGSRLERTPVCHSDGFKTPAGQGPISIRDKLGDSKERTAVERLYPEPSLLQATIRADADRFQKALHEATPGYTGEEPVHVLYQRFLADIVAEQFSSEFWKNEENMTDAFDKETDPTLQVLASKMKSGLALARDAFQRTFANAVQALGFQLLSFVPVTYENFGGFEAMVGANQAPMNDATLDQPDEAVIHLAGGGATAIKMSKLTYHVGESLGFTLQADTDCFVKIIQLGVDRSTTQLVPNGYNSVNRLRARERRVFPGHTTDGSKELAFTTTLPGGAETLLVLVSRSQLRDDLTAPSSQQQPFRGYTRSALIGNRGAILIQAGAPDSLPKESTVAAGQVGYQLVE